MILKSGHRKYATTANPLADGDATRYCLRTPLLSCAIPLGEVSPCESEMRIAFLFVPHCLGYARNLRFKRAKIRTGIGSKAASRAGRSRAFTSRTFGIGSSAGCRVSKINRLHGRRVRSVRI